MTDHELLIKGVADGYPLSPQHPARDLESGNRFLCAFAEAAVADTIRAAGNKLVLTEAGRAVLARLS